MALYTEDNYRLFSSHSAGGENSIQRRYLLDINPVALYCPNNQDELFQVEFKTHI